MKKIAFWGALLALLLALQTASAQALSCKLSGGNKKELAFAADENYKTFWTSPGGEHAGLILTAPEGEAIGGVYVQFYDEVTAFDVQTQDESGAWQTKSTWNQPFLTGFAALAEPAETVRIRPAGGRGRMFLAEVQAFAPGDVPEYVQRWEAPLDKADMLVLAAHPDDELLFLGGTIPTYAGERGLDVQVAYLVPSMPYRRLELLSGLWLCGVRHYPVLGAMPDRYSLSLRDMYAQKGWNEARILRFVAGLYRGCRPEVVVTQDVQGEYGHGAHRAAADAAQKCIVLAADEAYQQEGVPEAPWQVKKLYLHLYEDGALRMDWTKPLEAFGGKTALDMVKAGFACHISQQHTDYEVEDFGPNDCAKFGLAFTAVGPDEAKDDFMEHIP